MPIVHEGLAREFEYVTREDEREMILEQIEAGDALMQEMAYSLITGNHHAVDELTQQATNKIYFKRLGDTARAAAFRGFFTIQNESLDTISDVGVPANYHLNI